MTAVVGAIFLAAGVILYQWGYIEHRRPKMPAWLRHEFASQMLCFGMLLSMAVGASMVVRYFLGHGWAGLDVSESGMLLATAAVLVLAIAALQRYWRRRRVEWAALRTANVDSPPANDPRPAPAGGSRRRAA